MIFSEFFHNTFKKNRNIGSKNDNENYENFYKILKDGCDKNHIEWLYKAFKSFRKYEIICFSTVTNEDIGDEIFDCLYYVIKHYGLRYKSVYSICHMTWCNTTKQLYISINLNLENKDTK